ncbi:MAG TPA: radical SAM family heme chaperone HemW [Actinomycetes bacterium]|nr:radical SAM family heme chaperone HemW [Actinomycetes bacterium]
MPHALPAGEPVPTDGRLPDAAAAQVGHRPLGAYVHVPFCVTRCGYCDFNTYTADELQGTSSQSYLRAAVQEMDLAQKVVPNAPPLGTVFFGGGTPTMLPSADLVRLLEALRSRFGLRPDAEVTTEANPESVTERSLTTLREGGFGRVSFGMQSAVPHVLAALDRVHTPGRVAEAVGEARRAGFRDVSVDLIYGAPRESLDDWRRSLESAIALEPDHVSAYALIVEDGTRLASQIHRGELRAPDDDEQAAKYELADGLLAAAGYDWYEVSNWARGDLHRSRHNLGYWLGDDWWGFGPGAHSHVAGVRWWNVKHPRSYAQLLGASRTPAAGRELLSPAAQHMEHVLLEVRLRDGLSATSLDHAQTSRAHRFVDEGLLDDEQWANGRAVLTLRGRLLADLVVRELVQ